MMLDSTVSAAVAFTLGAVCSLGASFLLVSRLERLAGRIRLSEAMLGLVVALAADSPEITSAVAASLHGQTSIGAGVVLGSNVFNLAALLGLGAIVARRISLHRKVVTFDGVTATWVAVVTVVVIAATLEAGLGLGLVLVVVVPYVVISASSPATLVRLGLPARAVAWLHTAVVEEESELAVAIHPVIAGRWDIATVLGSLVVVVAASTIMERSAETLGKHFNLSSLVVGGIVLAAVTSLPNAVGAVFLASRGRGAAVLSEAMNSNMLNVLVRIIPPRPLPRSRRGDRTSHAGRGLVRLPDSHQPAPGLRRPRSGSASGTGHRGRLRRFRSCRPLLLTAARPAGAEQPLLADSPLNTSLYPQCRDRVRRSDHRDSSNKREVLRFPGASNQTEPQGETDRQQRHRRGSGPPTRQKRTARSDDEQPRQIDSESCCEQTDHKRPRTQEEGQPPDTTHAPTWDEGTFTCSQLPQQGHEG